MLTLGIETATHAVGVGLGDEVGLIGRTEVLRGRRHAETLVPAIETLLARTELTHADITAVAVDVGPGLFTGLRVGVAAAKAFALALGVPVVTATSLEILAHEVAVGGLWEGRVAAIVDARRKEVYAQLFDVSSAGAVPCGDPWVGPASDVAERIRGGGRVLGVGDGVARHPDVFSSMPGLQCLAPASPSVAALLALASLRSAVSADEVELVYLRAPDAEINWVKR